MAVVFVGTSASDFIGGMTVYTSTAQSRDTDYASEEIAAVCISNIAGGVFQTPDFTVAGNLVWVHFRMVLPTGSNGSSADGEVLEVRTAAGTVLGGIDLQDGNIRAKASTFIYGTAFSHTPGTVYTVDLKVDCAAGYDVEMYIDGLLVSSAFTGTGARVPAVVVFSLEDMLGVGSTNADMYISEFMVDDATTTLGCRVHTATASTSGTYAEMAGSVSSVQDAFDSDFLLADADGERFSWNPPAYTGDVSGTAVRAVLAKTAATTASAGPDKFTPFLRIGGTDYYGDQVDPGSGVPIVSSYSWSTDPSTAAVWDIADVDAFEVGIRANT